MGAAFSSVITSRRVEGTKKKTAGTFASSGGATGGDIDTGLRVCEEINLQHTGASAPANAPAVNETLPVAGNAVTIVTVADTSGRWEASGK